MKTGFDVYAYAKQEMSKHLDESWIFRVSHQMSKTLGVCKEYRYRNGGEIVISRKHVIDSPIESVKDTILHEIAHAIAGSENNHNEVWKSAAKKIGVNPEQYASFSETQIKYKYYLVHPELKVIVSRGNRKTKWVKFPENYCLKGRPSTFGELKVLSFNELTSLGLNAFK